MDESTTVPKLAAEVIGNAFLVFTIFGIVRGKPAPGFARGRDRARRLRRGRGRRGRAAFPAQATDTPATI